MSRSGHASNSLNEVILFSGSRSGHEPGRGIQLQPSENSEKKTDGAGTEFPVSRPPNLLLILTDQQRRPRHWPDDPEWLEQLMPADTELARTGVTFTEACAASCMCSPSRTSLLTGRWPAEHGVELTLTRGGARVNPRNLPATLRAAGRAVRRGEMTFREAAGNLIQGALRRPNGGRGERELDPATPNLARILERAGYRTVLKGKWHLTQPVGTEWSDLDRDRLADEYGFQEWEPPDAGENTDPQHFGGGRGSGASGEGFDEDFTRQAEAFLADPPPEPWALIVSLVNPHDVLGYPASFAEGGYNRSEWADLDRIELPATVNENLAGKPRAQAMMKLGQIGFLGDLADDRAKLDYCRFYAHLHRLADTKIGRILTALGDPADPDSLRSKTVIMRTSDHGEMGLAHGGMRQKMFNAYDETLNVPLVISNPVLFPEGSVSAAPVSLCDLLPTAATLAGVDVAGDGIRGLDLTPILADAARGGPGPADPDGVEFSPVLEHPAPAASVQDFIHFTYDDHQAASAYTDVAPLPNRIRAIRSPESSYAVYLDPAGEVSSEFELYDMTRDPLQVRNLVDRDTGRVLDPADEPLRQRMHRELIREMEERGTRLGITPDPV